MRQWEVWCADAHSTRADLPFLAQSTLRTLAPSKEAAVAEAKQSIDRILASVGGISTNSVTGTKRRQAARAPEQFTVVK